MGPSVVAHSWMKWFNVRLHTIFEFHVHLMDWLSLLTFFLPLTSPSSSPSMHSCFVLPPLSLLLELDLLFETHFEIFNLFPNTYLYLRSSSITDLHLQGHLSLHGSTIGCFAPQLVLTLFLELILPQTLIVDCWSYVSVSGRTSLSCSKVSCVSGTFCPLSWTTTASGKSCSNAFSKDQISANSLLNSLKLQFRSLFDDNLVPGMNLYFLVLRSRSCSCTHNSHLQIQNLCYDKLGMHRIVATDICKIIVFKFIVFMFEVLITFVYFLDELRVV